jgi:uncharacterized protein YrzB (UPF0473 family)
MSDNTNKTAPVEEEYDMDVYTLVDEDGVETDFEFLGSIELDGNTYVAFSPLDQEEDSDEEEYVVFKVSSDEEGNEVYDNIEDDEEFDRVSDAFEDAFWNELDLDSEDGEDEE